MTLQEEMLEALKSVMMRGVLLDRTRDHIATLISRAQAEASAAPTMREALEDAHVAIGALIHAENNPHSEPRQRAASDAVRAARASKRAVLETLTEPQS